MPRIYEILVRGKSDGSLSGSHIVEWLEDGTNPDGSDRYKVGDARAITEAELAGIFGQQAAQTAAQIVSLEAQVTSLTATKTTLETEKDALTIERDHLSSQLADARSSLETLNATRNVLNERTAERDALAAQVAEIEPLKEQIRVLKGVPKFNAVDLLKLITDAEKEYITKFVAGDDALRPLWVAFLTRVTGEPIPIDSQTFLAAYVGLTAVLGQERVTELFTSLNIDLRASAYIDPVRAV